jgi:hypothetical protein
MSTQYVARAYLEIDGSTIECSDVDTTSENGLAKVNTMNRANRAKGYTDGIPEFGYSATVPVPKEGLPVDLDEVFEEGREFGSTIELEGGRKQIYTECRISSLSFKASDGERGEYSLEVMSLDMVAA